MMTVLGVVFERHCGVSGCLRGSACADRALPATAADPCNNVPDGSKLYVTSAFTDSVSVIDTASNAMVATIPNIYVGFGVAVSPDGSKLYVTDGYDNNVWVIATATNAVITKVPAGNYPYSLAVTPDGSRVYVTNFNSSTVSVIDTTINSVTDTISGFDNPTSFGIFIQPSRPAPKFAGTPGKPNCYGQSVSALVRQYGGLARAAAARSYSSAAVLQNAIAEYCAA